MASRFLRLGSQLASTILFASVSACGMFGGPVNPSSATQPPEFVPTGGQSKCKLSANQLRPLIVEWSAADRAALEVLAQRGTVVVRYSGCEMEILPRCRAPGAYRYAATTRKTEQVVIQDEDELYANLPTGAFKLEGKLKRAGQLNVSMNVVGQYDNDQASIGRHALEGNCDKATHVVTGLTVGAFEFSAGGGLRHRGGAPRHLAPASALRPRTVAKPSAPMVTLPRARAPPATTPSRLRTAARSYASPSPNCRGPPRRPRR